MVMQAAARSTPAQQVPLGEPRRAPVAAPSPRQNELLAALPLADYERILPALKSVPLPLGWSVHGACDRQEYVYFITSGIVARFYVTESGATAGYALTGREGLIGIFSVLGDGGTPGHAEVQNEGHAFRIPARILKAEFQKVGPLAHVLLRYTQALLTQYCQTAACNRHHTMDQQMARLLLSCLDRLPSNGMALTHEGIGAMLGVRREGITQAACKLQKAGLIRYSRGRIEVLDRARLEARACECYDTVRRETRRLNPPARTD